MITGQEGLGSGLKITAESIFFPWQSALLEQTFQPVCPAIPACVFLNEDGSWTIKLHICNFSIFFYHLPKEHCLHVNMQCDYSEVTISWLRRSTMRMLYSFLL